MLFVHETVSVFRGIEHGEHRSEGGRTLDSATQRPPTAKATSRFPFCGGVEPTTTTGILRVASTESDGFAPSPSTLSHCTGLTR